MPTLMVMGDSETSRRCDAKCHNATTPVCDCVCGGRYHGQGKQASSMLKQDIKDGVWGGKVRDACEALLMENAKPGDLFAGEGEG